MKKLFKKLIPKSILAYIQQIRNERNRRKPYKTYSQTGEDRIIVHLINELGLEKASYIDIGAYEPYFLSNTALLYEKGYRGINIEPNPDNFKRFLEWRKEDINLNIGIFSSDDTIEYFFMENDTLNTFSKEEAHLYQSKGISNIKKTSQIKVHPVMNIIEQYQIHPNILSLDVEGLDELILRSINYDIWKPSIICVETKNFAKNKREDTMIAFCWIRDTK